MVTPHFLRNILTVWLVVLLSGSDLFAYEEDPFENRVNLALRQLGHNLLSAEGDQTTPISPVMYMEGQGFLLPLHSTFDYALLPSLIAEAFEDYQITEPYELMVKSCEDNLNLLGFNRKAVDRQNVPCIERGELISCANIYVQFPLREQPSQKSSSSFSWLMLPLLTGLGLLLLLKRRPSPTPTPSTHIALGKYRFDPQNLSLNIESKEQALTFREAKLLNFFSQQPNTILSREAIQAAVWEDEGVIVGRSLDVFVSRLRKHLKEDPEVQIKNIRGVGYRLEVPQVA